MAKHERGTNIKGRVVARVRRYHWFFLVALLCVVIWFLLFDCEGSRNATSSTNQLPTTEVPHATPQSEQSSTSIPAPEEDSTLSAVEPDTIVPSSKPKEATPLLDATTKGLQSALSTKPAKAEETTTAKEEAKAENAAEAKDAIPTELHLKTDQEEITEHANAALEQHAVEHKADNDATIVANEAKAEQAKAEDAKAEGVKADNAKVDGVKAANKAAKGAVTTNEQDTQHSSTKERKGFAYSIRTNLLYDAALVPNIGVELHLGKRWAVGANIDYAWWSIDKKHLYWRIYGGEITARKYFGRKDDNHPLSGHHIGLYGQAASYDFELGGRGAMSKLNYGAGIDYGYSLPIASSLNLDLSIGFGYIGGEYRVYEPIDECYVWQENRLRRYFGPSKAEISLVWQLGGNKIKKGGRK